MEWARIRYRRHDLAYGSYPTLGLIVESLVVMVDVKLKLQYPLVVLGESRGSS